MAPQRYVVEGHSMGPGLRPGDVVSTGRFSIPSLRAAPCRNERWIMTLPDGSTGLKRVIGLPGETVSIAGGDLRVGERVILKSPRELAQAGSAVAAVENLGARTWSSLPARVLDDAVFAPHERARLLLPVHDVGFAAEVIVVPEAVARGAVRAQAEAGLLKITWRIKAAGRYCVVAGRLDDHAVAAVWRIPDNRVEAAPRECLPPGAPDTWNVARPWVEHGDGHTGQPDDQGPRLALTMTGVDGAATISRVVTWRDILYRPAADGIDRWSVAHDEVFVLGDFPSGSRDSRHFGPLPSSSLKHRIP